jgi:hypothetical protein
MEFAAIMLFGYFLQLSIMKFGVVVPPRAVIAFISLVVVSITTGWVRVEVRRLTLEHVEQVVAARLADPSTLPIWNSLAREMLDSEVFQYATIPGRSREETGLGETIVRHCDLMSQLNGNQGRRELYARLLTTNHMLKEGMTLDATDLMLTRKELGVLYALAIISTALSVFAFVWAVIEVVRGLYREADREKALPRAAAGGAA